MDVVSAFLWIWSSLHISNAVAFQKTPILMSIILTTIRCEKVILRVSHASFSLLLNPLTKTMEGTSKHVTKVTVTEKWDM